jgi:4,5-DOPA dioxygenase extradiol
MSLNEFETLSKVFGNTSQMPVLFLGHGSPMNAIEENEFVQGFRNVAKTLPQPFAILCISAHWFTDGTFVTAMQKPRTIHDFYGFPKDLYDIQYPAKGSPELAHETKRLIQKTTIALDEQWGLDHGAWSVLRHLYPDAAIPVVQLSIDYTKPAQYHYELARQLFALRKKGILIIGSGNIVHNLNLADFQNIHRDNYGFPWAVEAREIFNTHLLNENFQPLIHYENLGASVQLAIPTPDHYLPLIYTLALKDANERLTLFNDKFIGGSLSMTCVKISK